MKKIQLTQDKYALVDDEDFAWLNQYKWHYGYRGYAARTIKINDKKKHVYIHRLIIEKLKLIETKMEVDHIDGNPLNNQKYNLRICTHRENTLNSRLRKDNKCGSRGVWFDKSEKRVKRWKAEIMNKGNKICLGYFLTKEEAIFVLQPSSQKILR